MEAEYDMTVTPERAIAIKTLLLRLLEDQTGQELELTIMDPVDHKTPIARYTRHGKEVLQPTKAKQNPKKDNHIIAQG